MAAKTYVVKALAALVTVEGGFAQLLHRGAVLPSNVVPDHLQHLLDNDIVEEGVVSGGLEPVYTGDLAKRVTSRAVEPDGDEPDDVDGDGPIPPKSADKATWVDYAVSKGATQADAEALTKDQLIEQYGAV